MEDTDAFTPNEKGCNSVLCKYKVTSDGEDAVSYKKALQQLQSTLRKDKYDGNGTMAQNDPLYKNLARCVGFFDNNKYRFPTQSNCTGNRRFAARDYAKRGHTQTKKAPRKQTKKAAAREEAKRAHENAKRAREEAKKAAHENAKRAREDAKRAQENAKKAQAEEKIAKKKEEAERKRQTKSHKASRHNTTKPQPPPREPTPPRMNSKKKRCPNGTRRNKKTGNCESH